MTNVGLSYSNEHVSASIGYTVGSENANVTTSTTPIAAWLLVAS